MTAIELRSRPALPPITWEILPADYLLPEEPVESNLQPLLASALRECLELAGLLLASGLIASNFGLCATVGDKTVVKAPDWVYVKSVKPLADGTVRRSYTPHTEGDVPAIVLEFLSETEGSEYSINPHFPYGKWYFYEQILQIPIYGIFHPKTGELDVYRLIDNKYVQQQPDENNRYWLAEINLFLGVWSGQKADMVANWLRWWDHDGQLLLWGSEQIEQERQRTEQERQRAEQAEIALEQERVANQRLAQKLSELGIDLNS